MDGLTTEAFRHLEKALTHDPNHIPALIALSNAYLDQGRFAQVEKLLKKALSVRNDQSEVFFLEARLLFLRANNEKAAKSIDEAIKLEIGQPKYYRLAADIAKARQKTFELQLFLERLIDLDPLDGEAHYKLGKLLRHPDDFDRVKLLFEISIDLLPNNSRVMFSLAQHLFAGEKSLEDGSVSIERDSQSAKEILTKILTVDPGHGKAKIMLAEIELEENGKAIATRLLQEAFEGETERGQAAYMLGLISEEKGDFDQAETYFKAAMEHAEWEALGEFRLALFMRRKSQIEEATEHFENCVSSFKKREAQLIKSKELCLEKLDFHESRKELASLQLVRKSLGEASLGIYKCKNSSQKEKEHIQYLDDSLLHYPHYPEANYEKGLLHIKDGENEYAKDRFEKAVEGDWNHWPSHMELASLAKVGKELQKAEMHAKIVLDLDPKNHIATSFLKKIQASEA